MVRSMTNEPKTPTPSAAKHAAYRSGVRADLRTIQKQLEHVQADVQDLRELLRPPPAPSRGKKVEQR
jgi:hypothetical protein